MFYISIVALLATSGMVGRGRESFAICLSFDMVAHSYHC